MSALDADALGRPDRFPGRAPTSNSHEPIILLVEDDDNLRERLATALRAHGYRVQAAADGAEAVDATATHTFDYAVVEPGWSDVLLGQLRGSIPKLNILVFTGYRRTASEAMRESGVRLLQKPADADDVLCALGLGCTGASPSCEASPSSTTAVLGETATRSS